MSLKLELSGVHKIGRATDSSGQSVPVMRKLQPYVRLNSADGPPVFVQNGIPFSEGTGVVEDEDLPSWFVSEAEKVSDRVAHETQLDGLLARLNGEVPEEPEAASNTDEKRKATPKPSSRRMAGLVQNQKKGAAA